MGIKGLIGMRYSAVASILLALTLFGGNDLANARVRTSELYINALMSGDANELENLLAPNFWYIGSNGHIRDKEHFIQEIRDKKLVVNRITFFNDRETKVGNTVLITSNGEYKGSSEMPRPEGLMRFTMVLANNNGKEQVALFQATPVIPTAECKDGNCKIR